jgi:hypothetical protein
MLESQRPSSPATGGFDPIGEADLGHAADPLAPADQKGTDKATFALDAHRAVSGFDIFVVPEFAQRVLDCDPNALLGELSALPTRTRGDTIAWAEPQWVDGTHSALKYRGNDLKRSKVWFQADDPHEEGFTKYYYTGWQNRVLPATFHYRKCAPLVPVWDLYQSFCAANNILPANHGIVTRYVDGSHGIGAHFDKPNSIAPSTPGGGATIAQRSMITVVKLGPCARRFLVLDRETDATIFDKTVEPGTAIMMTLEANLQTKHAVPVVEDCGLSGSIVLRSITDRIAWAGLESKLARMDAADAKKAAAAAATAAASPADATAATRGTKRPRGQ